MTDMILSYEENIKILADRYVGYRNAIARKNYDRVVVWGTLLLESQKDTGIELRPTDSIKHFIAEAKEKMWAA